MHATCTCKSEFSEQNNNINKYYMFVVCLSSVMDPPGTQCTSLSFQVVHILHLLLHIVTCAWHNKPHPLLNFNSDYYQNCCDMTYRRVNIAIYRYFSILRLSYSKWRHNDYIHVYNCCTHMYMFIHVSIIVWQTLNKPGLLVKIQMKAGCCRYIGNHRFMTNKFI